MGQFRLLLPEEPIFRTVLTGKELGSGVSLRLKVDVIVFSSVDPFTEKQMKLLKLFTGT